MEKGSHIGIPFYFKAPFVCLLYPNSYEEIIQCNPAIAPVAGFFSKPISRLFFR